MYNYKPLPEFEREFKRGYRAIEILCQKIRVCDYTEHSVFKRAYMQVNHYSAKRLKQVPIDGVLFPVSYFKETLIE